MRVPSHTDTHLPGGVGLRRRRRGGRGGTVVRLVLVLGRQWVREVVLQRGVQGDKLEEDGKRVHTEQQEGKTRVHRQRLVARRVWLWRGPRQVGEWAMLSVTTLLGLHMVCTQCMGGWCGMGWDLEDTFRQRSSSRREVAVA